MAICAFDRPRALSTKVCAFRSSTSYNSTANASFLLLNSTTTARKKLRGHLTRNATDLSWVKALVSLFSRCVPELYRCCIHYKNTYISAT